MRPRCLISLVLTVFVAGPASALSIDVDQPDMAIGLLSMAFAPVSQGFVPGATDISGAGFYRGGSTTADLTLSIMDDLPSAGGNVLASATLLQSIDSGYVDVFWAPVAVTPGQTYYLVVTGANYTGIPGGVILHGSIDDPYPDGNLHGGNTSFADFDLAFHTFTGVPEPSAVVLVGAGLVGLGLGRRGRAAGR